MRDTTRPFEMYRVEKFSSESDGFNGLFFIPGRRLPSEYGESVFLKVVASDGFGWDHVSVLGPNREATNQEMEDVRRLFWHRSEVVVEYHDPMVGIPEMTGQPRARHLWSAQGCEVIRPPSRISSPFCISGMEDGVEEYTQVESSNIAAVKYDEAEQTLFVVFTSGGHYAYSNVPKSVHDGLMDAESVGKFFHARIRNEFTARRIEDDE